ncbi:MAG: carbohydrate binding family 9 domain-containing protein [Ignavibacteriae bacterium]|nr:carbohydrate binding family 9 domain-containing protein [Ignavibacteriota bacterium]
MSSFFSFSSKYYANSDSVYFTSTNEKRTYITERLTSEKPNINGKFDDECWQGGNWAGNFIQWIPNEGAQPSQETQIKILYDDKSIYVAIRAFDKEPSKISRRSGRRDEFHGDIVGISFDSYHDHRTAFEFDLTAGGQKIDLLLYNPTNWDVNWNAVWKGEVGFEDSAWTAEFEIPFSQLRFSTELEQIWGMHCWRWIDRFQEESDWEPQSSKGAGIIYQFGELHGLYNLINKPPIELMPYILGELNTFKKDLNNPFKKNGREFLGNAGFDAKIGLSNNYTLDLTINPDFGQVEADPSVINLTAFETFYDEKRPFFLEGKNIFDFNFDGSTLFYSRRIGHKPSYFPSLQNDEYIEYPKNTSILSSLKLSGKSADGLAIGVLQSLTAKEEAEISQNLNERKVDVEPLTNYLLLRLQKDYSAGNTVLGGIATSTNRFINSDNLEILHTNSYTGGIDFLQYWNNKEYFVDLKFIGSYLDGSEASINNLQKSSARYFQRPDASHLNFDENSEYLSGHGGYFKIGKGSGDLWRYSADVSWRSPGLELNDMGYINLVDLIKEKNSISYFSVKPNAISRNYKINFNQFNNWDFGLNHLFSGADLSLYFEFLNKWTTLTSLSFTSQKLDTRILRGGNAMILPSEWSGSVFIRTDPSKKFIADLNFQYSEANENRFENYYLQPGITLQPMNTLKISFSLNFYKNRDELQFIESKKINEDVKYILGEINQRNFGATIRFDYNITSELSVQYYGSPFVSIGKYSDFKIVENSKASNYNNRISNLITNANENNYDVINCSSNQVEYSFENPDFNFFEFRSNLVLRWEYRAGSQIYFVWSQERNDYLLSGNQSVNNAFENLGKLYPSNIYLLKFNYWLDI